MPTTLELRDGGTLDVRPIRADDEAKMVRFHQALSEESVFERYAGLLKLEARVAHQRLARICRIDPDRQVVLVAEHRDEIVAIARLERLPGTADAEFALLVRDGFQRQGLGRALLARLIEAAREWGLHRIVAEILPGNAPMRRLCTGFRFAFQGPSGAALMLQPPPSSKMLRSDGLNSSTKPTNASDQASSA